MFILLFIAVGTAVIVDNPDDFKYSNRTVKTEKICRSEASKGMADRFIQQECN